MSKILKSLHLLVVLIIFIILTWFFAVPDDLIRLKLEDSLSESLGSGINATIRGLRKGPLFTIHAESLLLMIDGKEAIKISQLSGRFNPIYLFKKGFRFFVNGKIGNGEFYGNFNLPATGTLIIDKAELDAIRYLNHVGFKGSGHVSANLHLKDNTVYITFEIPDLNIIDSGRLIFPLADTFHKVQGIITLHNDSINFGSLGFEGEKGYARIKGNIKSGLINLTLELMPYSDRLTHVESMLISKYQISPGYYVIPVKWNFRNGRITYP